MYVPRTKHELIDFIIGRTFFTKAQLGNMDKKDLIKIYIKSRKGK